MIYKYTQCESVIAKIMADSNICLLYTSELILKQYLKKFNVGTNGRIITDGATIRDIADNKSTPVLVMTCQDNGTGTPMI